MAFTLQAQNLDLEVGGEQIILLNQQQAFEHGIAPGDRIDIIYQEQEITCIVDTTKTGISTDKIGLYREIHEKYKIPDGENLAIRLAQKPLSLETVRRKIKRYQLSYQEVWQLMKDIVDKRLGLVEKAYFLSTIYNPGYSDDEVFFLTKAMAETGTVLRFDGVVADKHSIGGIAGKGITPLVVSIVGSYGVVMPNTSTRSITTPEGTADILETVMRVSFSADEVKEMVKKINCCMVWGGGLDIAPADDELIKVERPLEIESFDKFLISIIAKKVAMGINHLLIDIPAGPEGKVSHMEDLAHLKTKFIELSARFGIKTVISERFPIGIDGNAVGPMLEMREVLYILEDSPFKSKQLEQEAVRLSGLLLELCNLAKPGQGEYMAHEALGNGKAYQKFKDMIKEQGGNDNVISSDLTPFTKSLAFTSVLLGKIKSINNKNTIRLARILGCPLDRSAGIYFHKKPGDTVQVGDPMFTIYFSSDDRLALAKEYLLANNLFTMTT